MNKISRFFVPLLLILSNPNLYAQAVSNTIPLYIKQLQEISQKYIDEQGSNEQDLNTALIYAKKAEALSRKLKSQSGVIRSQLLYSQICREKKSYAEGNKFVLNAVALAQKHNDYTCKGEAYIENSYYFDWGKGLLEKIRNLELALEAFRVKSTDKQLAGLLSLLSDQHFNIGNYSQSIKKGKEALSIYKNIGGGDLQAIYATLGISHTKLGLYEEGIRYSLLAAKEGENKGNTSGEMMAVYNHIGLSAYYNNNFKLAKTYHEKYLNLAILNKKNSTIFFAADNILNDLLKDDKAEEAALFLTGISKKYSPTELEGRIMQLVSKVKVYTALRQLDVASGYYKKLRADVDANPKEIRPAVLLNINHAIIALLFEKRQYNEAKKYLEANKKIAGESSDVAYIINNMVWDFKLDSVAGNYLQAIKTQQRYMGLKDSLFNNVKANQIANFHIEYESQKKDLEILKSKKNIELLGKEAQLQKAKIESDRNIKLITGVALLLSLTIIALLYNRYTIKKNKSIQLSIQKQEIDNKNEVLSKLVREKEWLLKEVHHRVKNNLQIIMSLLYAQSEYLTDATARMAILSSQGRVQSMALIHQKLYRSETLSVISMPGYITEFIDYLKEGFDLNGRINFVINVEDIEMDVSQAVPLGLILNEAVTNAIKHAYPDKSTGDIAVSLLHSEDDIFELSVRDYGPGINAATPPESHGSLGMTLMKGLAGELDGDFIIKNENGVAIMVRFKYNYTVTTNTTN